MTHADEALTLHGPDLGIATAIEVLGWHRQKEIYSRDYAGPFPAFTCVHGSDADYLEHWYLDPPGVECYPVWKAWAGWHSIKDAWQVVKCPAFTEGPHSFSHRFYFAQALKLHAPCASTGERSDPLWALLWLMDTPEAICHSALYAVRRVGAQNQMWETALQEGQEAQA